MKISTTTSLLLATALAASAAIRTETIEYKHGDVTLEGHLTYEDSFRGPRPGVLVVHQWKGLSYYDKQRSEMLARLGYVAFAVDIYGKGVRPQTVEAAGAEAGKYKNDRALLRARVNAGLEALRRHKLADARRVAAIGYCFGGTTVLEMARSGADVAGVVSFHGALDSPRPEDGKNIKCKVLALHGADDPFVPDKDVAAFVAEMRGAKVDWQLVQYGGAVHSFTDWKADGSMPGAKYDERADKRSWEDMKQFLAEIFK
jgi:dienelactone hydrolase